jgi:hypothetical protein
MLAFPLLCVLLPIFAAGAGADPVACNASIGINQVQALSDAFAGGSTSAWSQNGMAKWIQKEDWITRRLLYDLMLKLFFLNAKWA